MGALRYTGLMTDGTDPRAQKRVGAVLDEKWTLEHLIGAGGMGAVYAARHRNGARAAVKILHPELARLPDVRERFLREGYAANRVEHRGVVQVLDDDIVKTGDDEGLLKAVNAAGAGKVLAVGHEPTISMTLAFLLAGDDMAFRVEFKKGAVACLSLDGIPQPGGATLRWLVPPRVLRTL